jgi:hypothetical protein
VLFKEKNGVNEKRMRNMGQSPNSSSETLQIRLPGLPYDKPWKYGNCITFILIFNSPFKTARSPCDLLSRVGHDYAYLVLVGWRCVAGDESSR